MIAVVILAVAIGLGVRATSGRDAGGRAGSDQLTPIHAPRPEAEPSGSPARPADPEPPRFDVAESGDRAPGYPSDWREITAGDGSFRVIVRSPVYLHDLPANGWELEIAGGAPAMYVHGRDIGIRVARRVGRALALRQLERWVRGEPGGDPGRPTPVVSSGRLPIDGWETRIELDRRIDTYRMFAVRGWLVGLWASSPKNDLGSARLGEAFLSSFEALRRPESGGTVLSA